MGDSMLHEIKERRMSKSGFVKVMCFPGSTIADLKNSCMQPILSRTPSHVMRVVGTNDARRKDSIVDCILDGLLGLRKDKEARQPNVTVVISTPVRRTGQSSAGKIGKELSKKVRSLRPSLVDNNKLCSTEERRIGLHLNYVVNTGSGTKSTPNSNFWLIINIYKTLCSA